MLILRKLVIVGFCSLSVFAACGKTKFEGQEKGRVKLETSSDSVSKKKRVTVAGTPAPEVDNLPTAVEKQPVDLQNSFGKEEIPPAQYFPIAARQERQASNMPVKNGYVEFFWKVENLAENNKIAAFAPKALSTDFRLVGCSTAVRYPMSSENKSVPLFGEIHRCLAVFSSADHPSGELHRGYVDIPFEMAVSGDEKNGQPRMQKQVSMSVCILPVGSSKGCEKQEGRIVVGGIEPSSSVVQKDSKVNFTQIDGTAIAADVQQIANALATRDVRAEVDALLSAEVVNSGK